MFFSPIRRIRIVAPPHRAKEHATADEAREGDTIEILDHPVRRVDPVTRTSTEELQQFVVGHNGALCLK